MKGVEGIEILGAADDGDRPPVAGGHPGAWDAWRAGDITYDKAERISRTLGRLVRDNSKALLNAVVVDMAVGKTGELLGGG